MRMPLHLDLNSYPTQDSAKSTPNHEQNDFIQQIVNYSGAILNGIGHGIGDIGAMVRDFGGYPILDAHIILALATHPDLSEIDTIMQQHPQIYRGVEERMASRANTLYQLSLLALDTGILWAKYDPQNPDVQDFQTLISVHPEVCHAAEGRMHQRAEHWGDMYQQLKQSSGQEKVSFVSQIATTFLAPGALLKSLDIVSVGIKNLRDFGMFFQPPKFSLVKDSLFSMSQFKLLSVDEISKTPGMLDCIWVLTKENQLLIAPAELSKGFKPAKLDFMKEPLQPRHLTRMLRCDWVYASGEAMFSEGKLIGLFNDTKSFQPIGEHLENLVTRAFTKNGFNKDFKMHGFHDLESTVKNPFSTVTAPTLGTVSTAQQLFNHECERLLKSLEKLDIGSQMSSFSAVSLDMPMHNGVSSSAFQEAFKRHFTDAADSLTPRYQEELSAVVSVSASASDLNTLSSCGLNDSLPLLKEGHPYEQQIQKAISSSARLEFSTPTQWHSGKDTIMSQIEPTFFSSDRKASSMLGAEKYDVGSYLAGSGLLSSHSIFSVSQRQVQENAERFYNICKVMKTRTFGE